MPTVQKKDNTSTQNPLKHWKVTCHTSYVSFSQLRQIDFFLGLRNYHLKTKQFTSIYILYMFVPLSFYLAMRQIKHFTSCNVDLDPGNPCDLHHVQRHHLWLLAAFQCNTKRLWIHLVFKSTPLSLKLKKNTLMTTCQVPLDLSPCFVRVQVLIVVPRWCFWKWMCLGVWVLEMHVCGETLSIFDWLITRFGHVIPADTCCVPFVSTILKSAHFVIESYDVQTSKSVIFDMIQIFFKQSDTLKLLILSNKQSLSSSWIFIFPSTGSALELSRVSTLSYTRTPSYQTKHGKRRRDFFVATLAKRRSPAYHRKI